MILSTSAPTSQSSCIVSLWTCLSNRLFLPILLQTVAEPPLHCQNFLDFVRKTVLSDFFLEHFQVILYEEFTVTFIDSWIFLSVLWLGQGALLDGVHEEISQSHWEIVPHDQSIRHPPIIFFFCFMFEALHFVVNGVGAFNEVVEDVLEEESGVVGERGSLSK